MNDVRTMIDLATRHVSAPDPVAAVTARVAQRRSRRVAVLSAAGTAAAVAVVVAVVALPGQARQEKETPVVAASSQQPQPTPLPSGAGIPVSVPPDSGVDLPDSAAVRFAQVVTENQAVFVGTFVDDAGTLVAAFAPGADAQAWAEPLRDAAGPHSWRTTRCTATFTELDGVQRALTTFDWPSKRRPAFGAHVDARTCSVLVRTGTLPTEDVAALREAFGNKITIDQSGAPSRR